MIVLDTNVLSELMRKTPDAKVLAWVDAQFPEILFTTAITQAEILYGIALLPDGKRRSFLEQAATGTLDEDFAGRVLPFGSEAAEAYAGIVITCRAAGRPISQSDAQIAAIAQSRGATLATRNTADFESCGVPLVNPWV